MNEQILDITFTINGRVKFDQARAEEDPWWETLARGLDLNDPEQLHLAIQNYVSAYLRQENLLSESAPFTCGPADIYSVNVEIKNDRNTSNASTINA